MKGGLIILFLLFLSLSFANAAVTAINPGHSSEQIYIQMPNSKYVTLQKAMDSSSFSVIPSSNQITTLPSDMAYHLASKILITAGSYKMTLQEAIDNRVFLSGATTSYTTSFPIAGELASNVNVNTASGVMSLQDAINQNKLSNVYVCVSTIGQSCPSGTDPICVNNLGTIQCDGSCGGTSFKAKGTSCATNGLKTCDGTGHCLGWGGRGCGGCPFGSSSDRCNLNGNQGRSKHPAEDSYNSWSYSTRPKCEQDACCAWQLICITQRCSFGYDWQMKP